MAKGMRDEVSLTVLRSVLLVPWNGDVQGQGEGGGLAGRFFHRDREGREVVGAEGAQFTGETAGKPLGEALRGGVVDRKGADFGLWDDITSCSESNVKVAIAMIHSEVRILGREEECVVQLLADGGDEAAELDEVEQPGVAREVAFELDGDGVIMAVKRLTLAAKCCEMGGSEAELWSVNVDTPHEVSPLDDTGPCGGRQGEGRREAIYVRTIYVMYVTVSRTPPPPSCVSIQGPSSCRVHLLPLIKERAL